MMETETQPGWKTSEFYLSIVAIIGGVVLISLDRTQEGAALIAFATGLYSLSRGWAKSVAPTTTIGKALETAVATEVLKDIAPAAMAEAGKATAKEKRSHHHPEGDLPR